MGILRRNYGAVDLNVVISKDSQPKESFLECLEPSPSEWQKQMEALPYLCLKGNLKQPY